MRVYLDFDGVICDSVEECFIVSYLAFYETYERDLNMPNPTKLWKNKVWKEKYQQDLKREINLFREYRPFIKSAEDFMLLQRAIATNAPLENEAEYAFYREEFLKSMDYEQLYAWRKRIYEEDPQWWYSLHALYQGIPEALSEVLKDERFIILSTKEEIYIHSILLQNGVVWPLEQIKTEKEKLSYIDQEAGGEKAVLVDDQREFGKESLDYPDIKFYLADWGYIRPEWILDLPSDINRLSLNQFPKLILDLKRGENI